MSSTGDHANLLDDDGIDKIRAWGAAVDGLLGRTRQGKLPKTFRIRDWFPARITGWAAIIANARWKYAWEEILLGSGDVDIIRGGGRHGTLTSQYALNWTEVNNIAAHTGVQGNSVSQLAPYPAGFQLLPVGGGANGVVGNQVIVMMSLVSTTDRKARPMFQYQNADGGTCT